MTAEKRWQRWRFVVRILVSASLVLLAVMWFGWCSVQQPFVRLTVLEPQLCCGDDACGRGFPDPVTRSQFRTLAQLRQPLLLRNASFVQSWPASRQWSPESIAQHLPVVPVHEQEHPHNTFITFHDGKPLEPLLASARWQDFNVKHNVSLHSLFHNDSMPCIAHAWEPWLAEACAPPHHSRWLYFSARTQLLHEFWPSIEEEVDLRPLGIADTGLQANLWLGSAGVVTHAHYDASWNFFVQIKGRKRFSLLRPNVPLPLYPCLHPHIGHLAVNLTPNPAQGGADGGAAAPLLQWAKRLASPTSPLSSMEVFTADLGPGDILVVPPMWFHHVTTLSDSISFNVWSDAPEYVVVHSNIYTQPLPFETSWAEEERVASAVLYLQAVCHRVITTRPASKLAGAVPLSASSSSSFLDDDLSSSDARQCGPLLLLQRYAHILASLKPRPKHKRDKYQRLCSQSMFKHARAAARLKKRGDAIGKRLLQLHADSRYLFLHNYIEHVMLAVTSVEDIVDALMQCAPHIVPLP